MEIPLFLLSLLPSGHRQPDPSGPYIAPRRAPPTPRPAISALRRSDYVTFGLTAAATVLAGVLTFAHAGAVLTFVASAASLSLLAMLVGHATDQLGSRMGPGATGVLQSALGNLPELFVCIFSLRAGLVTVVQSAIVGSILANSLLVLGLAIVVGGLKHGTQRFATEPPRMIATLLLLAVGALMLPTLAHELHTPAEPHETTLSAACAIVLLIVFAASVPFSLKGDPAVVCPDGKSGVAVLETAAASQEAREPHPPWPLWLALATLAVAGVGAAFVSEWFVGVLTPTMAALGLSEAFTGLVIVAIAGNAVENVVGIQLAARNKTDYAMSVILNSSLQIALAVTPVLVLLSFFVGTTPLTLVLPPLLMASLAMSAIISAIIVFDGESIWLEGVALIGLYAIIAASFWWG